MDKVAKTCDVAPIKVYEVATFYTMFNRLVNYPMRLYGFNLFDAVTFVIFS